MTQSQPKTVACIRCGHRWTEDLARLARQDGAIYKGDPKLRVETYRLVCPNCGTANMLDVTFEEDGNA